MEKDKLYSTSENQSHAIYGAMVQARDTGITKPVYTIDGKSIIVEGSQNNEPWYNKYYCNPYVTQMLITGYEEVVIHLGDCELMIKGYPITDSIVDCNKVEERYIVKLLSKQLDGMKKIHSNLKADELEPVINEYGALERLEYELKHSNDMEEYETVKFEDGNKTQYHFVSKKLLQQIVRGFKAKQAREG